MIEIHAPHCDWHFEQYDYECNCGASKKLPTAAEIALTAHDRFQTSPFYKPLPIVTHGGAKRVREAEVELIRAVANGAMPGFVEAENINPGNGYVILYRNDGSSVQVQIKPLGEPSPERAEFNEFWSKVNSEECREAVRRRNVIVGLDMAKPGGDETAAVYMDTATGEITAMGFVGGMWGQLADEEKSKPKEDTICGCDQWHTGPCKPKPVTAQPTPDAKPRHAADDFDYIRQRMEDIKNGSA